MYIITITHNVYVIVMAIATITYLCLNHFTLFSIFLTKSVNDLTFSKLREDLRSQGPTRNAYAFLEEPIYAGRSFCVQIVGIDQSASEAHMSLGIGCTTCKPTRLNPHTDLPDDADELLDRGEYWVVYKNLFNAHIDNIQWQIALADELCFRLDETSGNLSFYINSSLVTSCLFHVDITQKLWFFFDLCGKTTAIRIIPPCQTSPSSALASPAMYRRRRTSVTRRRRPNSALIEYYKNQLLEPEAISESVTRMTANKANSKQDNSEECRICLDAPIECVFYSCGHMCVCWNW